MKQLLAFLLEKDGRSLKVQNDVVTSSIQATPLPDLPDGLTDVSIGWERNMDKVGLQRNFSAKLKFFGDAADIITYNFYRTNIERELFLLLTVLTLKINTLTYKWRYDYVYKGELDFSTFSADDSGVEISIMEGGLSKYLNANSDTKYAFPLDDAEAVTVIMDGIALEQTHNFLIPKNGAGFGRLMGISFLTKEGEAAGFASFTVFQKTLPGSFSDSPDYFCSTSQAIDGLHVTGTIKASCVNGNNFSVYIKNQNGDIVATLIPLTVGDGLEHEYTIDTTFNAGGGDKFFLISDSSFLVLYAETHLSIAIKSRYRTTECKAFKPSVLFKKLAYKMTGRDNVAVSTLMAQYDHILITCGDAVRGIKEAAIKTTFNDFYKFCKYMMGAGMGIENDKIVIESYEHFLDYSNPIPLGEIKNFKHYDAKDLQCNTLEVGYQPKDTDDVNGKLAFNNTYSYSSPVTRVVKKESYIIPYAADPYYIELTRINLDGKTTTDDSSDNEVILLDAKAADVLPFHASKQASSDYTVPSDITFDFISGSGLSANSDSSIFTYNGFQSQTVNIDCSFTPQTDSGMAVVTLLKNSDTLASKVVVANGSATNGITATTQLKPGDTLHIKVMNQGTTLSYTVLNATLRVVFPLSAVTTYNLNRPAYSNITGIPAPESIFNTELSPKHIMERQRKWIDSAFWGFQGSKLRFETTDKNKNLSTTLNGVTYDEDADYVISKNRLFIPVWFEVEALVPIDLIRILEDGPNRCFSFIYKNKTYKGFNINSGIVPATNESQSLKLLCTPDTDVTNITI